MVVFTDFKMTIYDFDCFFFFFILLQLLEFQGERGPGGAKGDAVS